MTQKWKDRESVGKQGKFRVGDLIRLSHYGKKTAQNDSPHFDGTELGYISSINIGWGKYPIQVKWINIPTDSVSFRFFSRELKIIRT